MQMTKIVNISKRIILIIIMRWSIVWGEENAVDENETTDQHLITKQSAREYFAPS